MNQAPRLHFPARLEAGQEFATLEQILACSDLAELTVKSDFWRDADGTALAVRVRALDLAEQDRVRSAAARAVDAADRALGVEQHWPTFVCMTLALGLSSPRITTEQALALQRKNARAVELLTDLVWKLSSTSQDRIDALFAEIAGPTSDA